MKIISIPNRISRRESIGVSWRVVAIDNFLFIATKDVALAIDSFDRRATTYVVAIDLTKKKTLNE
jgi:hypothetical protein